MQKIKFCDRCKAEINSTDINYLTQDHPDLALNLHLKKSYFKHLCPKCIAHFEQLALQASSHFFPDQKATLIEGLHYYKEGGYWVFTELYHYLRGYCCNNSCRHCVYGFNKNSV